MEKSSQPQVLIVGAAPKPSMLERAIGVAGVVGGGLVGTYYGLKAYGGGAHSDIDVTKPGSWEMSHDDAMQNENLAADAKATVDEQLARASGKPAPKTGTVARAEYDANAKLDEIMRSVAPDVKLNATQEGGKHTANQRPLGIIDTPYKEHTPQPKPGGKAAPRVISAKQAKHLIELATADTGEVSGVQAITYERKGNILSAKLHLADGPTIHIPEIDPVRVGLGSNHLGEGVRYVTSAHEVGMGAMQIIPNALARREIALAQDTGIFKATWGALKKLDGQTKFNIAGVTLMGVIFGGVLADVAKTVVRSVSHIGTVTPARGEGIKPR